MYVYDKKFSLKLVFKYICILYCCIDHYIALQIEIMTFKVSCTPKYTLEEL